VDAPVESPNPFFGLHAAVPAGVSTEARTRRLYPAQKLTLLEALRGFTKTAYTAHAEDRIETAPGYLADLLVWIGNPFRCEQASQRLLKENPP